MGATDVWSSRVEVGDERRTRRVVEVAARVAARPAGTVTEVFDDSADREVAYRLLSNEAVKSEAIAAAMFATTAKECARNKRVYVATDGSSLSMTDNKHVRDVGSVGRRALGARGLHVVSALALDAQGLADRSLRADMVGARWPEAGAPQRLSPAR